MDGCAYATYTTCAIAGGTLSCGPSDLAGGAAYTVHLSSPTSSATATSSPVANPANVTTTNYGSCTASPPDLHSFPTRRSSDLADNASVSAGDAIGFTVTVTNNGTGIARNVALNDALPTDTGSSYSIDPVTYDTYITSATAEDTLSCGPSDPAGGASYTVHVSSPTTSAKATSSPVENTANVTTTNDGSDTAPASVEFLGFPYTTLFRSDNASVSAGDAIGFTVTVTNNGTGIARNVALNDALPT